MRLQDKSSTLLVIVLPLSTTKLNTPFLSGQTTSTTAFKHSLMYYASEKGFILFAIICETTQLALVAFSDA